MADKYPNVTPYLYCGGNPIMMVDPDGREKHNRMNPDTENIKQYYLYEGAARLPEIGDGNSHILFFSHGSPNAMYPYGFDEEMTATDFVSYLNENSDLWRNTEDKSVLTIVLISCETGQGDNPIAKQISKLLPETLIIAPTEEVRAFAQGDIVIIGGCGKSWANTMQDLSKPENRGEWRFYLDGNITQTTKDGYLYNIYSVPTYEENE